ncbi:MAG: hypothetical protein V1698_01255 [bacterium]
MFDSFWGKLGCLILVASIGASLFFARKEMLKNKQIQNEVSELESQLIRLEEEKERLQNETAYFETEDFQRKEIKRQLGMRNPDERVIVIVKGEDKIEQSQEIQPKAKDESVNNWWNKIYNFFK